MSDRGPGILIPPPLYYVAGFALGWLLERRWPLGMPRLIWVALPLFAAATLLGFSAAALFVRARTGIFPHTPANTLVTWGPYRFSRNPMYLGLALVYAATALALGWGWPLLLLAPVVLTVTHRVIRREEPYLERRFGSAYLDYKSRVRRWI